MVQYVPPAPTRSMRLAERIDHANAEAARRLTASRARWVGVQALRDVVLDLGAFEITHGGPPLRWREMGAAQRDAVLAAVLFEGWASTPAEARGMLDRAEVSLRPNHHAGGVGAGAGVGSPTAPVYVVEERAAGERQGVRSWAPVALPGLDAGAQDARSLARRRRWRDALAPALGRAVADRGGVDLDAVVCRALHMGDELGHRAQAATALTLAELAPALAGVGLGGDALRELVDGLTEAEGFFGAVALAAAKLACDGAQGVDDSTVVTAMSRNGARCGVRLSGTGDRWFTALASPVRGALRDGYEHDDAGGDLGDSAIAESAGLGAFALAGAPALHARLGTRNADGLRVTRDMAEITVARHPRYTIPALEFAGAPVGVDARRVLDTGILPVIGATVVHRAPGHPPIGAGLTRMPMDCFIAAIEHFADARGVR
jgi:hypothetical protein